MSTEFDHLVLSYAICVSIYAYALQETKFLKPVVMRADLMAAGDQFGWAALTNAAAPLT